MRNGQSILRDAFVQTLCLKGFHQEAFLHHSDNVQAFLPVESKICHFHEGPPVRVTEQISAGHSNNWHSMKKKI